VFPWPNRFKLVRTRLHLFLTVRLLNRADRSAEPSAEPVRTSADKAEPVGDQGDVVKQLEARIEDLRSEIEFYRDELRDRRHTTEALTDVIEAFRLTAQSNASKAFERTDNRRSHDIRPAKAGDRWPGENAGDGVQ
jgi:TolA-binding protein